MAQRWGTDEMARSLLRKRMYLLSPRAGSQMLAVRASSC